MSLFDMSKCSERFRQEPRYTTPEGSTISAKRLFQALLTDAVAAAFTLDVEKCKTPEAMHTGTKANVLCAQFMQEAKVRETLQPIIRLVAENDIDGAKQRAATFAQDLQRAKEDWKNVETAQAFARVHAALSVTLSKFLPTPTRQLLAPGDLKYATCGNTSVQSPSFNQFPL